MVYAAATAINEETAPLLAGATGEHVRHPRTVMVLTAFAAIGGFLFGYDTGVISGAMLLLKDRFSLSATQQELVVSLTVAGAIVGAAAGGRLTDQFGRRPIIIVAAVIFTAGAALLAIATAWIELLVGRAILGVAIGLASMTVPVYLAETAPAESRGRILVINNLFITGGQCVAGLVDGAFSDVTDGWRYMLGLAAAPAIMQLIGFLFLPESPRWLVEHGRYEQARAALRYVRHESVVEPELAQIQKSFAGQEQSSFRWSDLQRLPHLRRALVVGIGLQAFQQLCGINTVMYYSATILKQAGIASTSSAIWLSAMVASCNFAFTLVGLALVERMGRRSLLLISATGVLFSLCLLGTSFLLSRAAAPDTIGFDRCAYSTCLSCVAANGCGYCGSLHNASLLNVTGAVCLPYDSSQSDSTPLACAATWASDYCPSNTSWLSILALMVYIAFFAPGLGPMPWTVQSEIFPSQYRSFGNSVSTSVNWIGNLIISMTFLDVCALLTEAGAFFLYAGFAGLAIVFVYTRVPETRGCSLEQVASLFEEK
eukprot:m.128582 g.128582  ORF g.128582 m.128582 type:complete len:542 (+) comp14733_c0_seq4:122-1747(+)